MMSAATAVASSVTTYLSGIGATSILPVVYKPASTAV
jgi:hypothetical protein